MKSTPSRVKPYFLWVLNILQSDPRIISVKIIRERYSMEEGFIQISVKLKNENRLEIFEYYSVAEGLEDYRYQLMGKDNVFIARWDTAPHHPDIKTHPYHLHDKKEVVESKKMNILSLLQNLRKFI